MLSEVDESGLENRRDGVGMGDEDDGSTALTCLDWRVTSSLDSLTSWDVMGL